MNIQEIVRQLAKTDAEMYCKVCTVDSVDEEARTVNCTPLDGSAPILDANLQANTNVKSGFCAVPSKGSHVVVGFIDASAAVVLLTEEIEKITLKVGDSQLEIANGEIVLNGGSVGAAKTDELARKLNNLENQVNNLLTTLQSVSIALAPSGTFPLAPFFATINPLTPTQQNELEDPKFKH